MCSTNMPHLKGISGVVVEKTSAKDLMSKYSPLNEDFKEVHVKSSEGKEFNGILEFISVIDELMDESYLDYMIDRNMEYVNKTFNE